MSGPAKIGALIYGKNIEGLSTFYIELLGMIKLRETNEFISLDANGLNIIIHEFPADVPTNFDRQNTVKLFFSVNSLENSHAKVKELGGLVHKGVWKSPIFSVCNVSDPEGNIFQLREFSL